MLSEDGKSALGCIILPGGIEHDHDAYYHAHSAVLDDAFQLISYMINIMEGESWEPIGISCVMMYSTGGFHQRDQETWAHVTLVNGSLQAKVFDFHLYNKNGLLMSLESFRYARLDNEERKASMYAVKWIQSSFHDSKLDHIDDD